MLAVSQANILMYLHIPTIFPKTLFPKDKYPVIATRTYMDAAEPILAPITLVVLFGELSLISFNIENI
jgi:hypothetical protein